MNLSRGIELELRAVHTACFALDTLIQVALDRGGQPKAGDPLGLCKDEMALIRQKLTEIELWTKKACGQA